MQALNLRGLVGAWLAAVMSPAGRRLLGTVGLADGCFAFVFIVALQSYFPEERVGGVAVAGAALAAFGAGKLLAQYPGGRLTDRLGSRRAATIAITIVGGSVGLLALSPSLKLLVLPAAAIYGVASAVLWPALLANAGAFPEALRPRIASAFTITTAGGVGAAMGLGIVLPVDLSFRVAMIGALAGAGIAFVLVAGLKDARPAVTRSAATAPRLLLNNPALRPLAIVFFLQSACAAAFVSLFRAIGHDLLNASLRQESLLLLPLGAAFGAGVAVAGLLGGAVPRQRLLTGAFALAGTSLLAIGTVNGQEARLILLMLACLGLGTAIPTTTAASLAAAEREPGAIWGSLLTLEGLGHALGPAAVAVLADAETAMVFIGGLLALAAVAAVGVAAQPKLTPAYALSAALGDEP